MDARPVTGAQLRRTPANRYQNIDLASRIESATPHGLVAMLYAELQLSLAVLARAIEVGDEVRRTDQQQRAVSILHALNAGLDRANGGALAQSLASLYGQLQRRLMAGCAGDTKALPEVRESIVSLADAWERIAA